MTRWPFLLALPGGLIIVAALGLVWLVRRARQAGDPALESLIKPPVQLYSGHDEALVKRTQHRRKAADGIRTRANHVASGAPVAEVLKLVRR